MPKHARIKGRFGVLAALLWWGCYANPPEQQTGVSETPIIADTSLSASGGIRATAYAMSNKIVSTPDGFMVTWIEADNTVLAAHYDTATETWGDSVRLDVARPQGGAALAVDSQGIVHAISGGHYNHMHYRHTKKPGNYQDWSYREDVGESATYPSMVVDSKGTLHLVYRAGRHLWYQKHPADGSWTDPLVMLTTEMPGAYVRYGNSLAVGPDDTLHLGIHFFGEGPREGKALCYLKSSDDGATWVTSAGHQITTPATIDSPITMEKGVYLDMRMRNLVVDTHGDPWFSALKYGIERAATLWHWNGNAWSQIDLVAPFAALVPGRWITDALLTFDADNTLYVVVSSVIADAMGPEPDMTSGRPLLRHVYPFWGHPSHEIHVLLSDDGGKTFAIEYESPADDEKAHWLPSIQRPSSPAPIQTPKILFMRSGPNVDSDPSEIILHQVVKGTLE